MRKEDGERREKEKKKKKRGNRGRKGKGRRKSRGQLADHVGAAPIAPGMATCQITHLARVNNYSETHVIALHYAYTCHVVRPQGVRFTSPYEHSTFRFALAPRGKVSLRDSFPWEGELGYYFTDFINEANKRVTWFRARRPEFSKYVNGETAFANTCLETSELK